MCCAFVYGHICSDTTQLAIEGTDTHIDDSGECSSSSEEWDFPHNFNFVITSKMKTRGKCLSKDPPLHKNAATQVEDPCIPNVSVRLPAVRNQQDRLFKPCYLEAISLLMAESLSASEAIRAIYIVDTTVWNQTRYLPLELDKMYTNSWQNTKSYRSKILAQKVYKMILINQTMVCAPGQATTVDLR